MTDRPLCIYHGNCQDGFGAAWVVRRHFPNAEFIGGVYQDAPPDVTGRDVIIVDFSYKRLVLDEMAQSARSVLVIDHHKSAAEDLAGLPGLDHPMFPSTLYHWLHYGGLVDNPVQNLAAIFDMKRSGAGLTWDVWTGGAPRPALINHIEDRDLWRFKLPKTREIAAALFSYPYDFGLWDSLMSEDILHGLAAEGTAIERKHHKDVAELVAFARREMVIGGITVAVANLPYTVTSDAGHLMATTHPSKIGVCYMDTSDGRVFSLRSTDDGPDVSAIAKRYGGGGHAHAAGFRACIGWEGDQL